MSPLRTVAIAAALTAALGACARPAAEPDRTAPIDTDGPGYVQPGTAYWEDWTVPDATVLLGTPFPEQPWDAPGMPEDPEPVSATLLLTGDSHEAMRDLHAQIEAHGLKAATTDDAEAICEDGEPYECELYGIGTDGYAKISATLTAYERPARGEPHPRLVVSFGTYSWFDANDMHWRPAPEPPQGDSGIEIPELPADDLGHGSELPYFGKEEPLGTVPEDGRLLAPPHNPSATYGFSGIFALETEAFGHMEALAEAAATGERYPDLELASGDLRSRRVTYDGSGGGCQVDLDLLTLADGASYARLKVVCD
ncbi:hypothetical protein [Glycomyces paridis]|uniref:Uncharacterized protein n=1 Tax=Glycomyces paridis TaxID=2126555 RepID=A0A4S8PKN3_9ACTN|nr:hypothetical protein [Glycomyces paridis]THV31323.1 hypothetical protein E9998_02845 [Glycomyces paridis]